MRKRIITPHFDGTVVSGIKQEKTSSGIQKAMFSVKSGKDVIVVVAYGFAAIGAAVRAKKNGQVRIFGEVRVYREKRGKYEKITRRVTAKAIQEIVA